MNTLAEQKNVTVAVFRTHGDAETAVKELQHAGFDMTRLSIVGADFQMDEHVVGYYNIGDRMKAWGRAGAFWGGVWGILFGAAFLVVPGIGPVLVGGPLVAAIIAALESAVVVGGVSAIGAGLLSLGVPKDTVLNYERAIKAGKYVLVAHGSAADVDRAREILAATDVESTSVHAA
jgi:hypothetical protein